MGSHTFHLLHTLQKPHVPWDLDLAKYQPRLGSPFGEVIQVTKVCIHLPTHKLHISALEIGRRWSYFSTIGEDHTPWATREYYWGTWTSFENSCKNPSWEPEQVVGDIPVKVVQSNNRPRPRDEKRIRPIFQNLRYEPTFHKYIREE